MSLPGGFSGRRFWGTQLTVPEKRYTINVDKPSTELHISKAILIYSNPYRFPCVQRAINIFVEYLEVRSHPDNLFGIPLFKANGEQQHELRTCLVCSLNTRDFTHQEAVLDLNFVAENRNISIYFQYENYKSSDIGATVNLSGYVVGG